MQRHSKEELDAAKTLIDFYINLVENNNSAAKFHLAENVVLDWFGKTVKGSKKVSLFIKDQVCKVKHIMTDNFPSDNVAFRETHNVCVPKNDSQLTPSVSIKSLVTPPNKLQASTSTKEIGQGDGIHNCPIISPPKRMKYGPDEEESETLECEVEHSNLKYVTAEGAVEFNKPSSKKYQTETRWRRPAKLHLGYTTSSFKDSTIYLIIYEGNLKCRRNLYKEFCDADANGTA